MADDLRRACVTLVTNDDFALGARALVRSLGHSGTGGDIVVMHTAGVGADALRPLADLGAILHPVDLLPTSDAFNARHARGALHGAAPFTKGNKGDGKQSRKRVWIHGNSKVCWSHHFVDLPS